MKNNPITSSIDQIRRRWLQALAVAPAISTIKIWTLTRRRD